MNSITNPQNIGKLWPHIDKVRSSFTKNLPYHNFDHCVGVAAHCLEGAVYYGLDEEALFLAGLYHDAGHLGSSDDSENIANALRFWGSETDGVAGLIKSTLYHPDAPEPSTLAEAVMKDSDMLESLSPYMLERLAVEFGRPIDSQWAVDRLLTDWAKGLAVEAGFTVNG